MAFNLFPEDYNAKVDEEVKESIQNEQHALDAELKKVSSKYYNYLYELDEWEQSVVATGSSENANIKSRASYGWIGAIIGLFIGQIIGVIIGVFVGLYVHDRRIAEIQSELEDKRSSIASEKARLSEQAKTDYMEEKNTIQAAYDRKIDDIQKAGERKKSAYASDFAEAVRIKSAEMASSNLFVPIVNSLTALFSQIIQEANRDNRFDQITASLSIRVLRRCIRDYKDYFFDFEKERFKPLEDAVEQDALGKVISTAVQINAKVRYPHDVSGTVPDIKTTFWLHENGASVWKLEYTTKNGYY